MTPVLRSVTRTQGNHVAVKTGEIPVEGFQLAFEEVPVLIEAFRQMVRRQSYDVCEMALTTYLCAKEHGTPFTALPVFLVRGFHHQAITVHTDRGIRHPKQLEGRRIGVNRGYTVTTGVWARGILADEYDVDLDTITWVRSGDEHVAEYQPPANVGSAPAGKTLTELLLAGELDAVVGADIDHPQLTPLITDPQQAAEAALRTRGYYPINHLIVVRDELLAAHPTLAVALTDAFTRAKDGYVQALRKGTVTPTNAADRMYQRVLQQTGADPLPYGVAANRQMLETLLRYAREQKILTREANLSDLFAAGTID